MKTKKEMLVLRRVVMGVMAIAVVSVVFVGAVSATSGILNVGNGVAATVGITICVVSGLAIMLACVVARWVKNTGPPVKCLVGAFAVCLGMTRTTLSLSRSKAISILSTPKNQLGLLDRSMIRQ